MRAMGHRSWLTAGLVIAGLAASTAPALGSSGTFERTWGKDVESAIFVTGFEICTNALACKQGVDGGLGGELSAPEHPAADSAGNVYVADQVNDRIQKFDSQGNFLLAWGRNVVVDGGVGQICTNAQAAMFPATPCAEICTVAASCKAGDFSTQFGGEFSGAKSVAVDGAGNVYVVDAGALASRVQKFNSQGGFLAAWGRNVVIDGGTGGTCTDVQAGTLTTRCFEICTVASQCQAGATNGLAGELRDPQAIAADPAGNVYVGDTNNARIQKFSSAGSFVSAWGKDVDTTGGTGFEVCTVVANCKEGTFGALGGELSAVEGIAAEGAGNVYVADAGNNRVQRFNSAGGFLRAWGRNVVANGGAGETCTDAQAATPSTPCFEICTVAASCKTGSDASELGGDLDSPEGIAADTGAVYVTDTFNERVQKFDPAGGFLSAWGKNVDSGGTTVGEVCTVAVNCQGDNVGALGGEFDNPEGVAVDPSGNVYVADTDIDRVQKFAAPPSPPGVTPTEPAPTGLRAAALKKCKKKAKQKGWSKKRLNKCRRQARKLPL